MCTCILLGILYYYALYFCWSLESECVAKSRFLFFIKLQRAHSIALFEIHNSVVAVTAGTTIVAKLVLVTAMVMVENGIVVAVFEIGVVDGSKIANITATGVPQRQMHTIVGKGSVGVCDRITSAVVPIIVGKGNVDVCLFHNRNTAWLIVNFAMMKTCLRITTWVILHVFDVEKDGMEHCIFSQQ